jgi:hypothetical protein
MEEKDRLLTFGFGCVLVRSLIAFLANHLGSKHDKRLLQFLGIGYVLFSIYFFFQYVSYDPQVTHVGVFWGPVWWNDLRLVHSMIYGVFAALAISKASYAWILLGMDVLLGVLSVIYHYSQ